MENEELRNVLGTLDDLLSSTNLENVNEENTGYSELKDGYYLSEVEKANLTMSKSSKQPMVAFQFKIVEDGKDAEMNEDGTVNVTTIKNTKNRKVFMYYVLKDESAVKRFVSDMLKFEGSEPNKPLLEKEYFTNSQLIEDALDVLVGRRIFIQVSSFEREDGTTGTWQNLITWKRASYLDLIKEN